MQASLERRMEYGEAINPGTFALAVSIARQLRLERPDPLEELAAEAVALAFCTCVTEGEDAAEHRLSDVHGKLIEEVAEQVRRLEAGS